jgi:uncharacterized membrane protein (DUF106 family)
MGIFDAAGPLLAWLDTQSARIVPAVIRLVIWGIASGLISMLLYRWLSDQDRIGRGKRELKAAQRALNAYDGELEEAWPLMRRLVQLALRQVGRVGWPAVVASLPLLFVLSWLSTTYGYSYPPPGAVPIIHTEPAALNARWQESPASDGNHAPHVLVTDGEGRIVAVVTMKVPVPVIGKHQWWNVFIGNPIGYLPDQGQVERIVIPLPHTQYLRIGPEWMKGWELPFFVSLLAVSLVLKATMRIV